MLALALILGGCTSNAPPIMSQESKRPPALGDIENGKKIHVAYCEGCHALDANGIGPAHRNVFGRNAGSLPGYAYSKALGAYDKPWTAERLNSWLSDPGSFIPGSRMGFPLREAKERADVIAYLQSIGEAQSR